MKPQPIPKKQYGVQLVHPIGLERIYKYCLQFYNCKSLFELLNEYSVCDGLLHSGNTTVAVEYKNRSNTMIFQYQSCLLEKKKYDHLMEVAKSINAPASLYIVEYSEAILIYDLRPNSNIKWETMPCQIEYGSSRKVDKVVGLLPYSDASIIISKKDWSKKTVEHLEYYIRTINERYYGRPN